MAKRLLLLAGVLVLSASGARAAAPNDVTLLLRSGDRVDGELASFDVSTVDVRNGADKRTVPWSEVVLMDFVGGARGLPRSEVDAVRGSEDVVIFKGGESIRGRVVDFLREGGPDAAVVFDANDRGRQEIRLDRVGRIYLDELTSAAIASAAVTPTTLPAQIGASTPNATGGIPITVPGNTRWMPTGVFVRRGERIGFQSDGSIYLRSDNADEARPAGSVNGMRASRAPIPQALAGALIGRIGGRGAPFGIGDQQSVAMPDAGELYLGINDDEVSDNQGAFTVRIMR